MVVYGSKPTIHPKRYGIFTLFTIILNYIESLNKSVWVYGY